MYQLLDLFSGIGGFSLGLEATNHFETVAFCEIESYPRKVLAKHWPTVPQYEDIRQLTASTLFEHGIRPDAISAGFPCQDISFAGQGAGIEGERSGLWGEVARLIGELGPRVVFLENVSALLGRGLDRVLGDLAALGYDAEWHCIPASAIGARHRRDRIWIIAYPTRERSKKLPPETGESVRDGALCNGEARGARNAATLADPARERMERDGAARLEVSHAPIGSRILGRDCATGIGVIWQVEPGMGRVVDGVPDWSHRLKALGNAIVPQMAYLLGLAFIESR